MATAILGISAYYHDAAAALLVDGRVVAAAQEERFSRDKHDPRFPERAIEACLAEAGLAVADLDYVGFYDKPFLTFERLLETYLGYAPAGFASFAQAMPQWLKQKLYLPREMRRVLRDYDRRFVFTQHHESHAASAFFPSPFEEAAILTMDGVGEWVTTSCGIGRGNRIELKEAVRFPHSLGLLYSAFTYYLGFEVNSGEYKVMGLAPYGEPRFVDVILRELMDLKEDGSFRMDMRHFAYPHGLVMTNERFDRLFGGPPRRADEPIEARHMDLAASVQKVTEEVMLRCARHVHETTGMRNLCLAGGVALNCVGNGRILREGPFDNIWIQPAAGDAGGALGVAQFVWHQLLDKPRTADPGDGQRASLLGHEYGDDEIRTFLDAVGARYERLDDEPLCAAVAEALDAGEVIGWFQGRMEFGPRALGARSILGDPRDPQMQSRINRKVKFREGFRPFAPIVLAEHAHEWFDLKPGVESPYMLLVTGVRDEKRTPVDDAAGFDRLKQARSQIPAVTHVDDSARVQTVDPVRHGRLRRMMEAFHARTGCPVLVNTSFNLGWEPIVESPRDAYETFMASEIDVLCVGNYLLRKRAVPAAVGGPAETDAQLDAKLRSPCVTDEVAGLTRQDDALLCDVTGHRFEVDDGIARMFWPHEAFEDPSDVTEKVKAFYEETPFPNYDDHDSVRSLLEKARKGVYARTLDLSIPYDTDVLEVGCGTGQLSNFLGIGCRRVVGADLCLNSLRLGERFRREQGLERVRFVQMNLFRPCFRPEQFDVVLCNGVLHHTADPHGGFRSLVPLVRPGGHIVIALYNTWGRLATDVRRLMFRMTGGRGRWLDPTLRAMGLGTGKHRAWFADQYQHPHESKHTMGEVLRWFDGAGLEFTSGVPALTPFAPPLEGTDLLTPQSPGTAWDRFLVQSHQVVAGNREGGFFVMIARKPGASAPKAPPAAIPAVGGVQ